MRNQDTLIEQSPRGVANDPSKRMRVQIFMYFKSILYLEVFIITSIIMISIFYYHGNVVHICAGELGKAVGRSEELQRW